MEKSSFDGIKEISLTSVHRTSFGFVPFGGEALAFYRACVPGYVSMYDMYFMCVCVT